MAINSCIVCQSKFSSERKARYCSNKCRQKAYRIRHKKNDDSHISEDLLEVISVRVLTALEWVEVGSLELVEMELQQLRSIINQHW